MSTKQRITKLERAIGGRFRVLFEADAKQGLANDPEQPGDIIIILDDDCVDL